MSPVCNCVHEWLASKQFLGNKVDVGVCNYLSLTVKSPWGGGYPEVKGCASKICAICVKSV